MSMEYALAEQRLSAQTDEYALHVSAEAEQLIYALQCVLERQRVEMISAGKRAE